MKKNTLCEQCYFADTAESEYGCKFGIPLALKDNREITVHNGYYKIHDYVCRYGVSKTVAETKLKDLTTDIEEYAKSRIVPNYLLYITLSESDNFNLLCDNIDKLSIQPKALSIVFPITYDVQSVQLICQNRFDKRFNWKLHMPIVMSSRYETVYSLLSTDTRLGNTVDYIFFLDSVGLTDAIQNDTMNQLNYMINVEQPGFGGFMKSQSNDYFNGLFITANNYKNLSIVNRDIVEEMFSNFKDNINYYD
jgi:hypothetical protein